MAGKLKKKITVGTICNYAIITLITFCCLYPFLNVIAYSLSGYNAVLSGRVTFYPIDFTLDAYKEILKRSQIWLAMRTTVVVTIMGTALSLLLTVCAAYALSRDYLPGRKLFTGFILFTMYFGGGMIPTFLVVQGLGLTNTVWAMIVPGMLSVYNVIVLRTSFESVPESLYESAALDGANHWHMLTKITIPLSKAALATITLFYAVGKWGEWYNALVYLQKRRDLYPLQMFLRELLVVQEDMDALLSSSVGASADAYLLKEVIKYATIIVTTVPILCVYPFLQKYFVKGVLIGGVKE